LRRDREALWEAAKTFADQRGFIVQIADILGQGMEWLGAAAAAFSAEMFPDDALRKKIEELIKQALWAAQDLATLGLDPQGDHAPWRWFSKALSTATGVISGFIGFAGAAVDVPVTTLVIMRSIAEIAREKGEDLASDDTKRAWP